MIFIYIITSKATDSERRLLKSASHIIIARETTLGSYLYNKLNKQDFLDNSNIKRLNALDVLKIVRSILPQEWSAAHMVMSILYAICIRFYICNN